MADVQRYGADLGIDYYVIREGAALGGADVAVTYRLDELGRGERIAVAKPDAYTAEEIARLPTLGEAIENHLKPALDRAEANRKTWLRQRESEPEPPPPPEPLDRATRRWLDDDDVVELPDPPRSRGYGWG